MKTGIVILAEVRGAARERVLEIQRRYDPKMAAGAPPHVTLAGSSGMGPIVADTPVDELRAALDPVARETAPITLHFLPPMRFMQTDIIVLPLDPHGPVRALHERILRSGLRYERPRFTFTPHVTLNFFRQLPERDVRDLLALRVTEPAILDRISAHHTVDMLESEMLLDLPLGGPASTSRGGAQAGASGEPA